MAKAVQKSGSSGPVTGAGGGALMRLGWMAAGPLAMLICLMGIAALPAWSIGWRDVALWSAVASAAAFRCIDFRFLAGETANGRPATAVVLIRYVLGLGVVASPGYAAQSANV